MFEKAKFGSTEFETGQLLKLNLSRMAAYKSYHVTRQLKAIKNKDSADYNKQASGLIKKYNRYQAVEYNTAVARARTAEQFLVFKKEERLFPNIEWVASRSAVKRDAHVLITGTILPQNHPFWEQNQPGNLWNCKCDWRTTNSPVTSDPGTVTPAAQGLDGNPARTREIFTNNHTYINSVKKSGEIESFIKERVFDGFDTLKDNVKVHPLVDEKATDFNAISMVASHFAKKGDIAFILPKVHFKSTLYKYIYSNAYDRKCPDLLIGDKFYEVEGFTGEWNKNKIGHMLSRGLKQCDRVVIDTRNGIFTDRFIKKAIYDMLAADIKVTEVWVIDDNSIRQVF